MKTQPSLWYKGDLTKLNGLSDTFSLAYFMANHEYVFVKVPFQCSTVGTITIADDQDFINVIKLSGKAVWPIIDLSPSDLLTTSSQAFTQAKALMAFLSNEFYRYNMMDNLAGFCFENFGYTLSPYSNDSILTRLQQNTLIGDSHSIYQLPVAVSSMYFNDLFSTVGPQTLSDSNDVSDPLPDLILGKNQVYRDVAILSEVLASSGGTKTPNKLAEALNIARGFSNWNMDFIVRQIVDISGATNTSDSGVSLSSPLATSLQDYVNILTDSGLFKVCFSDLLGGESTNRAVNPINIQASSGFINNPSYAGIDYSSGFIYLTYTYYDDNNAPVSLKNKYSSTDYSFVSSTTL